MSGREKKRSRNDDQPGMDFGEPGILQGLDTKKWKQHAELRLLEMQQLNPAGKNVRRLFDIWKQEFGIGDIRTFIFVVMDGAPIYELIKFTEEVGEDYSWAVWARYYLHEVMNNQKAMSGVFWKSNIGPVSVIAGYSKPDVLKNASNQHKTKDFYLCYYEAILRAANRLNIAKQLRSGATWDRISVDTNTVRQDLADDLTKAESEPRDCTYIFRWKYFVPYLRAMHHMNQAVSAPDGDPTKQENLSACIKVLLKLMHFDKHQYYAKVAMFRQLYEQKMDPALLEVLQALETFNYSKLTNREGPRAKGQVARDKFFDEEYDENVPRTRRKGNNMGADGCCECCNRTCCRKSGHGFRSKERTARMCASAAQEVELEEVLYEDANLTHINNNGDPCFPQHDYYVENICDWLIASEFFTVKPGRADIVVVGSDKLAHEGKGLDDIVGKMEASWKKTFEHFRDGGKLCDLKFKNTDFSNMKKVDISQEDEWKKIANRGHHDVSEKLTQRVHEIQAQCAQLVIDPAEHIKSKSGWTMEFTQEQCKKLNQKPIAWDSMKPMDVRAVDYEHYCVVLVTLQGRVENKHNAEQEASEYVGREVRLAAPAARRGGAQPQRKAVVVRWEGVNTGEKLSEYHFFVRLAGSQSEEQDPLSLTQMTDALVGDG
jgi:hypothetical protein